MRIGVLAVMAVLALTACKEQGPAPIEFTTEVTIPADQPDKSESIFGDNDYGTIDFDDPFDLGF